MKNKLIGTLGIVGIYLFNGFNIILALTPCFMLGLPWWGAALVCIAQVLLPFPNIQQGILFALSFSNALQPPTNLLTVLYFIAFGLYALSLFITISKFFRR